MNADGNNEAGNSAGDDGGAPRGALIAIVVVIVLAVGGFWLAQHMRAASRLQDCMMAGRTNCAPAAGAQ